MTIVQLRYLLAIIDRGGFIRAADHCHITQPTMSAQIRKLEEELGVLLFERTGTGIHVTPVGAQIAQHARILIEQAQAIKSIARGSGGFPAGAVRLGIVPSVAPSVLITAIRMAREKLEGLTIDVQEGSRSDLVSELKSHKIDLIIGPSPGDEPTLRWLPLFWEPYILSAREAANSVGRRRGGTDDLPVYLLDDGEDIEVLAEAGPTSLGVGLQGHVGRTLERAPSNVTSIATLGALLRSSDCQIVAPYTASVMIGSPGVSRRQIGPPNIGRSIGFTWRSSFPWSPRCYEIYDIVYANLPDGVTALQRNVPV